MALSRFWVALFLCSIGYLLFLLFSGHYYSIEFAVNGKKDEPLLQRESYLEKLPPDLQKMVVDTAHTVQASDMSFVSKDLNQGQTYSYTFTKAGSYSYICGIHQYMSATITVS